MNLQIDQSNIIINSEIKESVISWALDVHENYETESDDIQEEMESWTDDRIERWVNKNYDGGMAQFITDGGY